MKKHFPKALKFSLQLLFSVGALYFLSTKLSASSLSAALSAVSWPLVAAGVGLYLVAQLLSAWRWWRVANMLRFRGGLGRYINLYFLGMFYNIFLPTGYGGDVVKTLTLASHRQPPSGKLAALSIFIDRLTGLMALLFLGGIASCGLSASLAAGWGILLAVLFVLAVIGLVLGIFVASRWTRIPRRMRLIALLIRSRSVEFIAVSAASIIVQLLNIAIYALFFSAMGVSLSLWAVTFGYVLVTIATLLPVSIGGLGVRESGWAALMVGFGVSASAGVTAGLLYFAVQTISSAGGLWPFWTLRAAPKPSTPTLS